MRESDQYPGWAGSGLFAKRAYYGGSPVSWIESRDIPSRQQFRPPNPRRASRRAGSEETNELDEPGRDQGAG